MDSTESYHVYDPRGFRSLVIPQHESYTDYDCLLWSGPQAPNWKAPTLEWLEDEFTSEDDKIADFVAFGGGPIAISDKAYHIVKELFADQVEYLPTQGPDAGDNWRLLNVVNFVDVLDSAKSIYEIYDDGVVGMCQHGYLNEPGDTHKIFEVKGYAPYIFINEEAKNLIEVSGLTGALIREYLNPKSV